MSHKEMIRNRLTLLKKDLWGTPPLRPFFNYEKWELMKQQEYDGDSNALNQNIS